MHSEAVRGTKLLSDGLTTGILQKFLTRVSVNFAALLTVATPPERIGGHSLRTT